MRNWVSRRGEGAGLTMPLVAFFVSGLVYLRTMAPTVYNLDSAELATGAYTLGIVHPPGYPTYLLVARLFTFLPIGDVGYRVNLMSGLFGALTVTGVYLIARRLGYSPTASLTAALLLAFSYFFWTDSIVAEMYTFHTFFVVFLLLLLLRWRQRHGLKLLYVLALVYGLSFGGHASSVLMAPGLATFLLLNHDERDPLARAVLGMSVCFVLGFSIFAYLPLRYLAGALNLTGGFDALGAYHTVDLATWEGFRWFVTGELFRNLIFAYDVAGFVGEGARYLQWLWGASVGAGIALGVVGLTGWIRARPRDALAFGLLFLGHLAFYLDYAAVNKEMMFLPTYVIWSIWVAAGAESLLRELEQALKGVSRRARHASVLANVCLLALPLFVLTVNYKYADVSWDHRSRDWATEILQEVEPNAVVLGWWTDVQPMVYLQQVEGLRPDVLILSRLAIGPMELDRFLSDHVPTTPVYSANLDRSLEPRYDFQPQRRGYRLRPREPLEKNP